MSATRSKARPGVIDATAPAKAPPKTVPGKAKSAAAALPSKAPKAPKAAASPRAPAKVPASAPAESPREKPVKVRRRLVRDSFTMPQADFDLIGELKAKAVGFGRPAKKSELLRAGLQALAALDDARLRAALDALVPLKPGRPKKSA